MSTPLNVLILEDRAEEAKLLVFELRRAGIEVQCGYAHDEPSYLAALSKPLDVILADYALPSFDAMHALKLAQERGLKIPFIVVCSSVDEEVVVECMKQGAADYLLKDRLTRLGPAVRNAIEQHHLRIQHQRAEQARLESEALNRAVLSSFNAQIAVLDEAGVIVAVNQTWENFAQTSDDVMLEHTGVGVNYLAACREAGKHNPAASQTLAGIEAVLGGIKADFRVEYTYPAPAGERWFVQQVTPLKSDRRGVVVVHTEVTERKRAEGEQHMTVARLAGIVESAMDAIISIDESRQIILFNSAAEQMFGCPAAAAIGQPIERFVPIQAQPAHWQHIGDFGKTDAASRRMRSLGILSAVRAGGKEFPIEATISQIVATEQKIHTVIIRDITDRKRAEAALRASEGGFRVIFQMAPIGILLVDLHGYIIDSNQIFQDMIGYTGDELRAMHFTQFTHPDDRKAGREIYDGLIAGNYEHYSVERRYIHKNGQTIWGRPSASLVRNADGAPQFSIVAIENIADQKQASEARSRLAAIVDSSDDAILSQTLDGKVMSWNAGAERIYGYTAAEIINQPASILCPLDRVDEERRILEGISHGEGINHCETVHVRKDREPIDVSLTISPIRDTSGRLMGTSTIARDISERKRAEQALKLQTAFVQLLQAVAVAANQATSLEQALQTAIEQIATRIGWPVGHVYLAAEAGPYALASTNIWHFADPERFAIFQTITEAIQYAEIDDLPGHVLISGKPEWITDITAVPSMARAKLISDIGVRAGFAFPVLIGAEVAAVLEFFATEVIEPDEALLEVMEYVGTQLGRVVERTRAETAMRDSEERYRLIAENTGDIITLIRLDGRQIYVSPACESLLGYRPADMMGRLIFDLIHPDDRAIIRQHWASIQQESDARTTVRYQHADGSWRWFEVHGRALVQDGIGYIVGVSRDVTQRKQAEEALRAAEAKYRTLVEQIPAIIYTAEINEQSSTIYVSPQIETILGFPPEEWMADPDLWVERLHPDDRARVLATVGRAQASDVPVPEEYRSITRDGRVVWVQDTARIVRDEAGKPLFMQGITLDITERKLAEEAMRASEERFRTYFELGLIGVAITSPTKDFLEANDHICAILGYERSELLRMTWAEMTHPDDLAADLAQYNRVLAGEIDSYTLDKRWIRKDGQAIDTTISLKCLRRSDGSIDYFVGLLQDITERKRAEEALAQERALLARRVAERTADLSAANAELARAARLKDEFVASMSHELRTPLNAILGLSEALQEQVYGALNDQQCKTIHGIEESGRHLLELINDILDLAKIGAGKLELDIEPVAIESVCQASMRLIKQAAQKKRIAVETAIDPAIGHVHVDARRLKQILLNLLSNAVKFTREGGAIGLEVTCDRAQKLVQLSVWDTGIGIAEEQLPRLFQPFVQLDSRLARHYEGTGLGLALVYRMVHMHGGSIAVTSEVGVGSRFTVALPWYTGDTDVEPISSWTTQQDPILARPSAIRRALIIEDSPTATNQMTRYLQEFGIVTLASAYGAGALAEAIETQPDLIILDLLLPDMSGWDVLAQLKAEPRTQAIPIVIVSVMDDRSKGSAYGAAAYLVKPVTRLDVQQVLHTLESGNIRSSIVTMPAQSAAYQRTNAEPVVLLAEDNEANITTVSDYLAAHGYLVIVARSGAEAIARAREAHPCIVLMDIQMPGMDGLEATRRIRADRTMPQMPIIALTALAMPGDRERCLEAGASDYLSKPISLKELVAKLEMYLQYSSTEPRTAQ